MKVPSREFAGESLTPSALVEWLASTEKVSQHFMTDGDQTVRYHELPALFVQLDQHCAELRLASDHCVAFECAQSVAGAVGLLYFLSRNYNIVLLPHLSDDSKEAGTPRFIPDFCSYVITAAEGGSSGEKPESLLDGLQINVNPDYVPAEDLHKPDDTVLYLRTSGSTSTPKLSRTTHHHWLANGWACIGRWGLEATDRLAIPVPIFHSYGFGAAFLPGLLVGASMHLQAGFSLFKYLEWEKAFNPNVAFLTPTLCDSLNRIRKSARPYKLSVTAGDKIKLETIAAYEPRFGPLLNLYGSAEMGAVSSAAPTDSLEQRGASGGYPLAGIELTIREGVLHCRQRHSFSGYLVQQDSGWKFNPRDEKDWWSTGDLAQIRDDGYLELLGRTGLSVKRDGLLVVFADIESAMENIDGLDRVVIFSKGENRRGSRLVAACLPRNSREKPDIPLIKKVCSKTLPTYSIPDDFLFVESFPLLPSGKVNRRALQELI